MGNVLHFEHHATGPAEIDVAFAPKSGSFALRNVLYQTDTNDTPVVTLSVLVRGVEIAVQITGATRYFVFPNATNPQPIYLEAGSKIRFKTAGIVNDPHHVIMTFTEET